MNIFYLDNNINNCAKLHCDKHVVKMILESAQMLSTAHRELDNNDNPLLYKSTHKNHPCNKWIRESEQNYLYLYNLFISLSNEYTYRYNKIHLSYTKLSDILKSPPTNINKTKSFTQPPLCMPDEYKSDDHIESYRKYYKSKSNNFKLIYTKRETPSWL